MQVKTFKDRKKAAQFLVWITMAYGVATAVFFYNLFRTTRKPIFLGIVSVCFFGMCVVLFFSYSIQKGG